MAKASFGSYFKAGQSAYDWSDDDWGDFGDSSWTQQPSAVVNVNTGPTNADGTPRTDVQQNQINNPQTDGNIQDNVKNIIGLDVNTPTTSDEKQENLNQQIADANRDNWTIDEHNQNIVEDSGTPSEQQVMDIKNKQAGVHGSAPPGDPNDPNFMSGQHKKAKLNEFKSKIGYGEGQWAPGKFAGGAVLGGLGALGKAFDKVTDWNQDGKRFGTKEVTPIDTSGMGPNSTVAASTSTPTPNLPSGMAGPYAPDTSDQTNYVEDNRNFITKAWDRFKGMGKKPADTSGVMDKIRQQKTENVLGTQLPDDGALGSAIADPNATFSGSAEGWANNQPPVEQGLLSQQLNPTNAIGQTEELPDIGQSYETEGEQNRINQENAQREHDQTAVSTDPRQMIKSKTPGLKGLAQRLLPGGKEGYEYTQESLVDPNRKLAEELSQGKITQEEYTKLRQQQVEEDPEEQKRIKEKKRQEYDNQFGVSEEDGVSEAPENEQPGNIGIKPQQGPYMVPEDSYDSSNPSNAYPETFNPKTDANEPHMSEDYSGESTEIPTDYSGETSATPVMDAYNKLGPMGKQLHGKLESTNYSPDSIPDSLIKAITQVESGGASADSLNAAFEREGAVGPMQQRQIFRDEVERLDPSMKDYDPNDPEQAKKAAKIYLAHQLKTGLSIDQAIASYNAGRTGAKKGRGQDYANKVSPLFQAFEQRSA